MHRYTAGTGSLKGVLLCASIYVFDSCCESLMLTQCAI